jgi:tetratricopeptide (TPR) repeat protein
MPRVPKVAISAALLLFGVALVFGQTVRYGFLGYDDDEYVYNNPLVRAGLTWPGLVAAFGQRQSNNWHPLTWLSHMLDCQIFRSWPGGHHLTSLLLHATTAVVLFGLLRRLTGRTWCSAAVAALFAVHPLRAESVAWIAERKDVLSGLLFVLTLWAYAAYATRPCSLLRYLAVLCLYTLGLMAKPMLVSVPLVLLLLDYWPLGRAGSREQGTGSREWGTGSRERGAGSRERGAGSRERGAHPLAVSRSTITWLLVEKLPLAILAAVSCGLTLWAQQDALHRTDPIDLPWRAANAVVAYATYLGRWIWPENLAVLYPHPGDHLQIWKVVLCGLLLAGITLAAIRWRRTQPSFLVGWLFYLATLLPVIGLVQVGQQATADRYTYLPLIGPLLALVFNIAPWAGASTLRRAVCAAAAASLLAAAMIAAWRQTSVWRNDEALWQQALRSTSDNAVAEANYGGELLVGGDLPNSIIFFQRALQLNPRLNQARVNLATAYLGLDRPQEALQQYEKVVELEPEIPEAQHNLGMLLLSQGRIDEAIDRFQKALQIRPDYGAARAALAEARRARQLRP